MPTRFRRRPRVPAVRLRRRLEHGDRARALESAVVVGAGREQLQAELDRIGFRRRRRSSMNDSAANVACGPFGSRRLPVRSGVSQTSGRPTTSPAMRRFGMAYMSDGSAALPAAGLCAPRSHELRDQHGVGLVVAEVVVVARRARCSRARPVALRVQRRRASCTTNAGPLVSHAVSSSRIHCTRTGRPISSRDNAASKAGIVGGGAAVALRALHPDDADLIARHVEERRDAVAACRTTSCRSNRSSSDRSTDRPSHGAGEAPCVPGTGRRIRLRSSLPRLANAASGFPAMAARPRDCRLGVAGPGCRRRRRAAHVVEEVLG